MAGTLMGKPGIAIMRALSALGSRRNFASKAGLSFGGDRDLNAALGYPDLIDLAMYRDRYERNGVAARIIDTYPKSTWRGGGAVIEDETPSVDTDFEVAFRELDRRLSLWPTFKTADTLAQLGEYAILVLGVKGSGELKEELPPKFKAEDLIYVQPYMQEDAQINTIVTDTQDPRFGQPETYTLTLTNISSSALGSSTTPIKSQTKTLHHSRVIHIAEGMLRDRVYGRPMLRNVWNDLNDLEKVKGGGAEAFWLRAHQGFVASLDPDLQVDDEELAKLRDQVEEFAHQMRRTLGLRGVDLEAMGSDVAEYGGAIDAHLKLISVATGIPVRILTGSERGELASSQDKTNFDDRVADRRDDFAEPIVVRPFIDRLLAHEALPIPKSEAPDARNGYRVVWPDLDTLDESEKANVAVKYSSINKAAGETVITRDEIREVIGLAPLSDLAGDEDQDVDALTDEELDMLSHLAEAGEPRARKLLDRLLYLKKKPVTVQ